MIALVATDASNGKSTGTTFDFGALQATHGNLIVCTIETNTLGTVVTSITDNIGNTYVSAGPAGTYGGGASEIWYAANATPGVFQVVVNFTGGGVQRTTVFDVSGADNSIPLDAYASLSSQSGINPVGPAVSPTRPGGIIITNLAVTAAVAINSISGPFILVPTDVTRFAAAYVLSQPNGVLIAPNWQTSLSSGTWGAVSASFAEYQAPVLGSLGESDFQWGGTNEY